MRSVPVGSPLWSVAQLRIGLGALRARRSGEAARAFAAVAERDGSSPYGRQLRQLGRLSLARVHFERAVGTDAQLQPETGPIMVNALTIFEQVDRASPHGPDAALGAAWALFHLGRFDEIVPVLAELPAAHVEAEPEVERLRAFVAARRCDRDALERVVARVARTRDALEAALERWPSQPRDLAAELEPALRAEAEIEGLLGLTWRLRARRRWSSGVRLVDWLGEQERRNASLELAEPLQRRVRMDLFLARDLARDVVAEPLASEIDEYRRDLGDELDRLQILQSSLGGSAACRDR